MDETPETNPLIYNSTQIQKTVKDTYDDLMKKYAEDLAYKETPGYFTALDTSFETYPIYNSVINTSVTQPHTWNTTIYSDTFARYQISPQVGKQDCKVEVRMDDNSVEHITREELVKYISERKAIRENPLVRKLYERLQVALKLSRSDDNGETGI